MFPFLARQDCPAKFKILLNEKMIAYNTVQKNRQLLIENEKAPFLSESDKANLARETVKQFEIDQQIFEEFTHFHETREVLGLHPIFKKELFTQQAKAMSGVELVKAYKNLAPRISRTKKKIKSCKDAGKKEKLQQMLKELEAERKILKEIENSKLN